MPLGAAPLAFALWTRHLRHSPKNPSWFGRDRFVLSCGHGSMLLYSLLHLTGYDLSLEEIKRFRQWGSVTPGHPENTLTPGVEMATGPLGQGFATSVGMAIAERHLGAVFNRPGHAIVDHNTYVICSDGDLMEGVSNEAASLAGHLRLGKLIALYDDNGISIDGSTDITFTEDVAARFEALRWHVVRLKDGMDVEAVDAAIRLARAVLDRPSLIVCPTTIGFGSPNKAGSEKSHGAALGEEEVDLTKRALGFPTEPRFHVPEEVSRFYLRAVERGKAWEDAWSEALQAYGREYPEERKLFEAALTGEEPSDWEGCLPSFEEKTTTRAAGGKTLNAISSRFPTLIGGSADLAESNFTWLHDSPAFQFDSPEGRNLCFGVREHAMMCAVNGINLHGCARAYGASFLIFSDYCRPAIRLAALMHCPSIFVFTHDSVGLGEDGPTHQPIEHLMSLRAIPNLNVLRPADGNETAACWRLALERKDGPSLLALTRQSVPLLTNWELDDRGVRTHKARFGAYVLREAEGGGPEIAIIGTGSEAQVAMEACALLESQGVLARVVNMPSWFLFERQSPEYRETVLPVRLPAVSVEAGATLGWERYAVRSVGIDRFGASAPGDVALRELGITAERVAEAALDVLRNAKR